MKNLSSVFCVFTTFLFILIGPAGKANPVKVLHFYIEDVPKALAYEGELIDGRKWKDNAGLNYILFTQATVTQDGSSSIYFNAYHYVEMGQEIKLVRRIQDFEQECLFDITVEFLPASLYISDLDENGFAEITFMYRKGCRSDVSPLDLKLILLENGEKHAIRGTTIVAGTGGQEKIDPSFHSANQEFLSFAEQHWKLFKYEF